MSIEKRAGLALLLGTLLLVLTMVMHPVGGNLQHLLKSSKVIIVSHSVALLAIPFLAFGFWGLTRRLGANIFLSAIAFILSIIGLVAGMIAAAINGLALPIYISNYREAAIEVAESARPVLKGLLAINHAFDFIFIGAISLAMLCWSVIIVYTKMLPTWTGYLGIALFVLALCGFALGFMFVDLHGFRVFIAGTSLWIIFTALALTNSKNDVPL